MRNSLIIGDYEDCQSKLIKYGNVILNEGYKLSQVWQSEDNYCEVGVNFITEGKESIFLISERKVLYLEMDCENDNDAFKLINLWNIIKAYEQEELKE